MDPSERSMPLAVLLPPLVDVRRHIHDFYTNSTWNKQSSLRRHAAGTISLADRSPPGKTGNKNSAKLHQLIQYNPALPPSGNYFATKLDSMPFAFDQVSGCEKAQTLSALRRAH
eukprot:COSAG02_NODE_1739_length_11117_cov_14.095843_2_plen_114_part_00